jgi:putative flavoprotein involved in K+ transport
MTADVPRSIDTVVIGGGQAGTIMSWHLQRAGRDHVVLERRATLGGGWQDRWDTFTLVSPNWTSGLPGFPYEDGDPDGFMPRDEMVARIARYPAAVGAPVVTSTEVTRLGPGGAGGRRFHLETSQGPIEADSVVLAVGAFHRPRIPAMAAGISPRVAQLHSHDYRRPESLPAGGVLIVGTGQTGVQLAEELHADGRDVWLATGRCGRAPRRYRGHDFFWWARQIDERGDRLGASLPLVDTLPDPKARFVCNPHLSGRHGGHDTDLRRMALDGIHVTGRLAGADGEHVTFAPDLADNLRWGDEFFDVRYRDLIERFAALDGIDAGPDDRVRVDHEPQGVESLDLADAGIATVLWTTGYAPDYGWLDFPILDETGIPRQVAGRTEVPGLSTIGQLWQRNMGSANLIGVHLDAELVAASW